MGNNCCDKPIAENAGGKRIIGTEIFVWNTLGPNGTVFFPAGYALCTGYDGAWLGGTVNNWFIGRAGMFWIDIFPLDPRHHQNLITGNS